MRKLCLTGLLMTIRRGTIAQSLLGIAIAFCFATTNAVVQPYADPRANFMRMCADTALFFTLLCLLILHFRDSLATESEDTRDESCEVLTEQSVGWILIALNFVCLLLAVLHEFVLRMLSVYGEMELLGISYQPNESLSPSASHVKVFRGEYKAAATSDSVVCAVKVRQQNPAILEVESGIRLQCNHPNIIRIFHAEEDASLYYLATELCERSLEAAIEQGAEGLVAETVCKSIATGVKALHKSGFTHGNVTPSNILLGEDGKPRLGGFSCAARLFSAAAATKVNTICATCGFQPAEIIAAQKINVVVDVRDPVAVDVFSLGCTFCFVLSGGTTPFHGSRAWKPLSAKELDMMVEHNIATGDHGIDEIDSLSDGAKQFLSMMVSLSPAARPSLDAVVRHPAFDAAPKWQMRKRNAAFLSHFKNEAAAEARILKQELVRVFGVPNVFLDSDNLSDLRQLLGEVEESDVLVLLYTRDVLSRPWCLLELHTAIVHNVPIVLVYVDNSYHGSESSINTIIADLPAFLDRVNPGATDELQQAGVNVATIATSLQGTAMRDSRSAKLTFNPKSSELIIGSQVRAICEEIARVGIAENVALLSLLQSEGLQQWPATGKRCSIRIVHDTDEAAINAQAQWVKTTLLQKTDLVDEQIGCDETGSRAALGQSHYDAIVQDTDAVLFLQSSGVLSSARCLLQLHAAVSAGLPIVPVALQSSDTAHAHLIYSFEAVHQLLRDLTSAARGDSASGSVAQGLVQDIGKCRLHGVDSAQVGESIGAVLPNLISKSLVIGAPESTREAQLGEALSLLVERVSAAHSDQRRSESRSSLGSWSSSPTGTVTSVVHENPVAASSGGAFAF